MSAREDQQEARLAIVRRNILRLADQREEEPARIADKGFAALAEHMAGWNDRPHDGSDAA